MNPCFSKLRGFKFEMGGLLVGFKKPYLKSGEKFLILITHCDSDSRISLFLFFGVKRFGDPPEIYQEQIKKK